MISPSSLRFSLALAGSLVASACSRELPSQWPDDSPASLAAEELPPAAVTLALDSDPPLPGEAADGWIGLERPAGEGASGHQHGHQHHQAPQSPDPEPSEESGHDH